MVTLTFPPLVVFVLVGGVLIVLVLVAFFPDKGDNILRFCSALVDLYQRLQQILRQTPGGAKVKTQQRKGQARADSAALTCNVSNVSQESSVLPLPTALTQQEQNARGE